MKSYLSAKSRYKNVADRENAKRDRQRQRKADKQGSDVASVSRHLSGWYTTKRRNRSAAKMQQTLRAAILGSKP